MEARKELSLSDMEKVSGGTPAEAQAYLQEMAAKYGTRNPSELLNLMSAQEKYQLMNLMNHQG